MPTDRSPPPERLVPRIELPCAPPDKPIRERLDEPLGPEGEFRLLAGRPCILFASWDYAEDWSGDFVRAVDHRALEQAQRITAAEFWLHVRELQSRRAT